MDRAVQKKTERGEFMLVKDTDITNIIAKINDHFKNNITNRFLRKALLVMEVPQSVWDRLDGLQEKATYGKIDGFQLQELYEIIISAATFIHMAKKDILPRLKSLVAGNMTSSLAKGGKESESDKILREMAISNFSSNLGIFADMVNVLYMKSITLDKEANKNKHCISEKFPELKQIGQYLVDG
jgi:hypothetical protein